MKRLIIAAVACFANLVVFSQNPSSTIYPIEVDGLWGYIDEKGRAVIKPRFLNALMFSEGLAPVRLNGTYGYIDLAGEFVLKPLYDFAEPFYNGVARVYLDGKPNMIDKTGKNLFDHNFTAISYFDENGLANVATITGKKGCIDKNGHLVVDTIYDAVHPFFDDRAIVINERDQKEHRYEYGVINSGGRTIVAMNRFHTINGFKNGYAKVYFYDKDSVEQTAIIDKDGYIQFIENQGKWTLAFQEDYFSDDVFVVQIYKEHKDSVTTWPDEKRIYYGAVDIHGEIIVSDTSWKELTHFVNGRAFARDIHRKWYLVDKNGQKLNSEPYKTILYRDMSNDFKYLFQNGKELVETNDGWYLIDTDGRVIMKPDWLNDKDDLQRVGNIVYFGEQDDNGNTRYGYWDIQSGDVVDAQFHNVGFYEERGPLTYVTENGRSGYVNKQGIYEWRGARWNNTSQRRLNIDYMNRGYFYAASPYNKKLRSLGGWAGSKNMSMRVGKWQRFEPNKLSGVVYTVNAGSEQTDQQGKILYVANTSSRNYIFEAQDSRLYLKLQALDKNGKWKDIEYLPSSWCGNSYHQLYLAPNRYWSFELPAYEGEFKTRLRAELEYKLTIDSKEVLKLYSQEFEGSVNPGQFWRKKQYFAGGIMDPYND